MNSCFNLMRRLSPNDITKNVAGLANLIDDETLKYEVIQKIDQPLGKPSKDTTNVLQRRRSTAATAESTSSASTTETVRPTGPPGPTATTLRTPLPQMPSTPPPSSSSSNRSSMTFSRGTLTCILIRARL
jgi:hypothetical protein